MTTTPSGLPAWARTNDFTAYGGNLNKRDYNDLPIVNPQTDVSAAQISRIAADLEAVARMADFCQITVTMGSGSEAPTVTECRMMTGIYDGAGYSGTSPPTGFPRVTGVSDGVVDITFSGAYYDAYSVASVFQPTFCGASIVSNSASLAQSMTSGTDTVRICVVNTSGTGVADQTITAWVA
jgi:hypothetical protein